MRYAFAATLSASPCRARRLASADVDTPVRAGHVSLGARSTTLSYPRRWMGSADIADLLSLSPLPLLATTGAATPRQGAEREPNSLRRARRGYRGARRRAPLLKDIPREVDHAQRQDSASGL